MSVIATVAIPAEDFALGAPLADDPQLRVHLDRVVPVGESFIPYLWASDDRVEAIESSLGGSADVESVRVIDRANDEALVRVTWAEDVDGFLEAVSQSGASILEGIGEANRWRFQLRFDGHDELTAFYRRCVDTDVSVDLEAVHNPGPPRSIGSSIDLTADQRETLEVAFERGYFDVPRGVDLGGLADELGVSDSAVSQRIRRGLSTVLGTVVLDAGE